MFRRHAPPWTWGRARARALGPIAPGLLALAACSPSPRALSWSVELASPELRGRVELVHTEIREGGCGGPARYASEVRPGERVPTPPVLRPGRWGFAAEAHAVDCVRLAADCDELTLPGPTSVASRLSAMAEEPACAPGACSAGACAGSDAGLDAAGASDAPAPPRDVGVCPDAGPLPATPLRPSFPCGSTLVTEGIVTEALEVESGSITAVPDYYHRDGICGSGCREPVLRLAAGTVLRGRFSFVRELSLLVAREPGGGELTLEVCGRPYFGPASLAGSGDPGFNNVPAEGTTSIADAGECDFVIRATGGTVTIRRFDVACRAASGPPVVSVTIDGMESRSVVAPASAVLAWTVSGASSCEAMGAWRGPQRMTGTLPLLDLCVGRRSFALTCTGPDGVSSTDIAELVVE
jgi:hypothetical protein